MNEKKMLLVVSVLAIFAIASYSMEDEIMGNDAQVKIYPSPKGEEASEDYSVSVNGKPVFVTEGIRAEQWHFRERRKCSPDLRQIFGRHGTRANLNHAAAAGEVA